MIGALIGDYVGSRHEFMPIKWKDFDFLHPDCIFTDDSLMTVALADAIANGSEDYAGYMRAMANEHVSSYGHGFWTWIITPEMGPYGSWGNGSSMRVSPAAAFATDFARCMKLAEDTASVTHNHPEGIRGAKATAAAIYAAKSGWDAASVRAMIVDRFGYAMDAGVDDIRMIAEFELKSWISVPQALTCAFEATSFEDAIRNAVSLGGDADTQAAIAGSVAQWWFPVDDEMREAALGRLPGDVRATFEAAELAASMVDFVLLTDADVAALPQWDPEDVVRWNRERDGVSAKQREEIEKWEGIEQGINALPQNPQPGWKHRLRSAFGL